jgi:hypothetical protein
VTQFELPPDTPITNDFLEQNFTLTWSSNVMARKGVLPLKLAKETIPSFSVQFSPWTVSEKRVATSLKVASLVEGQSASVKLHLSSQSLNGQIFLQGKSTVLVQPSDPEVHLPISAIAASSGTFELLLEITPSSSKTEFFKSPYLINIP